MKRMIGWLAMASMVASLVAACGGPDQGPPLGPFAAISKTEADAPFELVPPSSKSPVPFTYTSSNLAVATIAGSRVTIQGPGQSTITASQAADGQWGPTSASTTLTVMACVAPAVKNGNQCSPPATAANLVHDSAMAWTGVSHADTWTRARDYCATITVEGKNNWRQPTSSELEALYKSGLIANQGWIVGRTWSSTAGTGASAGHVAVDLATGTSAAIADTDSAYVTCVR
jgi:hypothetical protein